MDQIISKLSNLGYELFGIFVPGLIFVLLLLIWFWSLGSLPSAWSGGAFGESGVNDIFQVLGNVGNDLRVTTLLMIAVLIYFLGHSLHWLSRSGTSANDVSSLKRTLCCLFLFRLLKPVGPYSKSSAKLFDAVKPAYGFSDAATWPEVFPVLKAHLAANLQTSLVSTYQNKYTLHRSIATAAAFWWWLSILSIGAALLSNSPGSHPRWIALMAAVPASFVLAWNFSSSYQFNWHMFGNTIVTESFMLKRTPGK